MISRKEKWAYRRARLRELRNRKFTKALVPDHSIIIIGNGHIIAPAKILEHVPVERQEVAFAKLFGMTVEVY